jgi:hypothetical protein
MIGTVDGYAINLPVRFEGRGLARPRRSLRRSDRLLLSLGVKFRMLVIVPLERAITMGGGRWRPSFEMHCLLWCWG